MKKLLGMIFLSSLLFFSPLMQAQEVQWAKEVVFSTNSPETKAGVEQILGMPDAQPYGKPNENSFRLSGKNSFTRVMVSFGEPLPARQLFIFENYLPGRVHKVVAYDTLNTKHLLYEGGFKVNKPYRILKIRMKDHAIAIHKLEISTLAVYEEGMAEIDAIAISSSDDPGLAEQLEEAYGIHKQELFPDFQENIAQKTNLGAAINSRQTELKPIVSNDGNTLFFSRQNHPENIGSIRDEQDIYFSSKTNGEWAKAQNLGTPVNNQYPNGMVALTPNGMGMYVINEYPSDGSYKKGLSYSHYQNDKWTGPIPVTIKGLYNFSDFVDYSLSANQDAMVLAMKRIDSKGGMDLYVSFPEGEHSWSIPKNMGKTINSGLDDFAPFLAADGRTLYFSSYGHDGYGEADIFISRRLDQSWQNWTIPENLGPKINGKGFDGYFTIPAVGPLAYMVSDHGSMEKSRDIFEVIVEDRFQPMLSMEIIGQVVDKYTLDPIPASLRLLHQGKLKAEWNAEPEYGVFRHDSQEYLDLRLVASYPGYQMTVANPEIGTDVKDGIIIKNILMEPLEIPNQQIITAYDAKAQSKGNRFRDFTGINGHRSESSSIASNHTLIISVMDEHTGQALDAQAHDSTGKQISSDKDGELSIPAELLDQPCLISSKGYLSRFCSKPLMKALDPAFTTNLKPLQEGYPYALAVQFHTGTSYTLLLPIDPVKELAATLRTHDWLSVTLYGPTGIDDQKALIMQQLERIQVELVKAGIAKSRIALKYDYQRPGEAHLNHTSQFGYVLTASEHLFSDQN